MSKLINKINKDRRLSAGLAAVFLILAYIIASLAINSGSLWQYFGVFICLVIVINLIKKAILKR
ncbi:MAG TPA: hypothetical protein VMQ58_01725 [Candidatus Saccharimonadales bacterium]|jgi:hypothetical protein|nr:hypothetical protein [Candidatus Saccharimonadales bacterium]